MNPKKIATNLIVLVRIIASFLFNTTNAQAGYAEREKNLNLMLASAVEFRWDNDINTSKLHESLGTKITPNTVLTHIHFSDLASTYILDPSNPKRPHGVSSTTRTTPFGKSIQYGIQTRLVYSSVKFAGSTAPIASSRTIKQLSAGDSVDVVYWDDARQELAIAVFQIRTVRNNTMIVLDDPADIINGGDSGGGVFYNGELVGNTGRYVDRVDLEGNQLDKEVHVQIVPAELNQVLINW